MEIGIGMATKLSILKRTPWLWREHSEVRGGEERERECWIWKRHWEGGGQEGRCRGEKRSSQIHKEIRSTGRREFSLGGPGFPISHRASTI